MLVLTPSGYKPPMALANGETLRVFVSGAPIVNYVENIDYVDYKEWCRWWQTHDILPAFSWVCINDEYVLFREQSIWRNGRKVCHARDLVVGDTIYDDKDHPIIITSLNTFEDTNRIWYRFDVDGDHSYVADGLTLHNASRFWVLGTNSWTPANTAPWSATSGGAGGASVPGSGDTVTFNGSSGGGTVTLNFGGPITIQSLAMGAFTGTWDNSANNNNITCNTGDFSGSGSGTRTINLGSATYTLTGSAAAWTFATATGLTLSAASANIVLNCSGGLNTFTSASSLSWGNLTLGAASGDISYRILGNSLSFNSITITAPNFLRFGANTTTTIATLSAVGTSSAQIGLGTDTVSTSATLALTTSTLAWSAIRDIGFTGSPTATNSFNLGNTSGITITAPSATGSASARVIGG